MRGMHKAMSYARMQEEEKQLKQLIAQLMRESEITDRSEGRCYGADERCDEVPDGLAHREGRLRKIQEAKAALEEEAKSGRPVRGAEQSEIESSAPAPKA